MRVVRSVRGQRAVLHALWRPVRLLAGLLPGGRPVLPAQGEWPAAVCLLASCCSFCLLLFCVLSPVALTMQSCCSFCLLLLVQSPACFPLLSCCSFCLLFLSAFAPVSCLLSLVVLLLLLSATFCRPSLSQFYFLFFYITLVCKVVNPRFYLVQTYCIQRKHNI